MKQIDCEFEADALAAALQSRWPEHVDAQLRTHVAECPICSGVVTIASAVDDARDEMRARAVLPDSGLVWWRAQLRARREAAEAAGHPITAAQLVAFACAVGLLGACFGATSTWFQAAFRWIASSLGGFDAKAFLHSATALLAQHGAFVLAMAVMLFLVPTAVYLALGRD
jgi:predicted anti-sigma-YlaC factor YlaD